MFWNDPKLRVLTVLALLFAGVAVVLAALDLFGVQNFGVIPIVLVGISLVFSFRRSRLARTQAPRS